MIKFSKCFFVLLLSFFSVEAFAWGTVSWKPAGYTYQTNSGPHASVVNNCKGFASAAEVAPCALAQIQANVDGSMNCSKTIGMQWNVGKASPYTCSTYYGDIIQIWSAAYCPVSSTNVAGSCTCNTGFSPSADGKECIANPCPQDMTYSGGKCVCASGQVPAVSGDRCEPAPACTSGTTFSSGYYEVTLESPSPATFVCEGNCGYSYDGRSLGFTSVMNGVKTYFAQGSYVSNGMPCPSYGPNPDPRAGVARDTAPKDTCPPGELYVQNAYGFVCMVVPPGTPASITDGTTNNPAATAAPQASTTTSTATTTTNPDGSTTTTSTSTTLSPALEVKFPNDYANLASVAAVTASVESLRTDLNASVDLVDPTELAAADMPTFGTSFDSLKGWALPVHTSTCPAPSIDLSSVLGVGRVYAFNAHCQLVQDHFAVLQAAMMVVWSMLALFVVLRA